MENETSRIRNNSIPLTTISEKSSQASKPDDSSTKKSGSSSSSENFEYTFKNGIFEKEKGLNWFITGLFVVGDLAGGGLVALPTAMIQLGIILGMSFLLIMNLLTMFTSLMLGFSWDILLRRWPEYRSHCRKPYPEMAYRAMGPLCKTLVSLCVDLTQFGIAVVYLLLSSKNIHDTIKSISHVEISFCYVILIVAICLMPILFLKSPQDFWWAVVFAMFTTAAAIFLILIGAMIDFDYCSKDRHEPKFRINNYFLGLGTLLFSFGGHSAFPTIQHDMKKPSEFNKSTILAFGILLFMYAPVCVVGYITYGDSLRDSVINSIQTQWIQQAVNLLIAIHCILTLTIVFNPLNQEVEDLLNVPHEFGYKRVLVRTAMMVAVALVAESVPTFGPLLDLMGGTTFALTSLILPPLFYVFLISGEKKAERIKMDRGYQDEADFEPLSFKEMIKETPKIVLILSGIIIAVGFFGGLAATYSAIHELSTTQFKYPCYVQPFISHKPENSKASTNCCGAFQNVTSTNRGIITCSDAKLDFYGMRD